MPHSDPRPDNSRVVMTQSAIADAVQRIAEEIANHNGDIDSLVLLGILSRGRPLADRIAKAIGDLTGNAPRVGSLATTLYRDDIRAGKISSKISSGKTHFDFDVDGKTVVLVDDVIAAGRTARAALDEVMDYGRPQRIRLACLVDRGLREVPIQPDFLGITIETTADDHVFVRLEETDGEDVVVLQGNRGIDANEKSA